MNKKGMLVIISGPSGTGKGTIVQMLPKDENYALSISYTTREPREGEEEGKSYFFTTEKGFEEIKAANGFLEYITFDGNQYGTPRSYVEEKINEGRFVVLEIEVLGALQVKKDFGAPCVLIFLIPPNKAVLEKRLRKRKSQTEASIAERLRRADEEVGYADQYDYLVVNDQDQEPEAVRKIEAIILAESLKPFRNTQDILRFKEKE